VANLGANNRFESICNDLTVAFTVIALVAKQTNAHLSAQRSDLVERFRGFSGLENGSVDLPEPVKIS